MNDLIIPAINQNLNKAITLITKISPAIYQDTSVGPYHSSIGSHMRHLLDFFLCITNGLDANDINLIQRSRDEGVATHKEKALTLLYDLQATLISYSDMPSNCLIKVTDDMGQGAVTVHYTLESILLHANSHLIHHFAAIGYILNVLDEDLKIPGFGYNPTTPDQKRKGI
ncbi:DinB family protein [Aquimarina brevivitae]|uniref:DinB family protein n=1 Tax=Aquimarina brevivitae TaxID=323412 RepID=A0A4Q7NZ94_9FLAO|nr:DinB family protein [Aquimarina brevivitae]RZS92644.1 hypothetical protein EV197_2782 [Aquimarina brevivitae]